MLSKFLLEVAYSGAGFSGWQYQPNKISIQQVLEEKLSFLYNTKINVKSAGRTDAGVHALGMPVIFKVPDTPIIPKEKLKKALNGILPNTISVRDIIDKNQEFDPRFDAVGKAYTYILTRKDPGPFIKGWCWNVPIEFDLDRLYLCKQYLIGEHDFSSFAVSINKTKKNPIREIYRIDIDTFNDYTCITFIGKSFLYKMVRSLVSSLIYCSKKNSNPKEIKTILESKDRSVAYQTAPASGLFLMKVFYEKEEWGNFRLNKLPFLY